MEEELEELKKAMQLADGSQKIICGRYFASGSMNIERIDHVENLFPGNEEMVKSVLAKKNTQNGKDLTPQILKERIECVKHLIKINRHWFSICKVLMLEHYAGEGDFEYAQSLILQAYEGDALPKPIDYKDIAKINVGGMKGKPEEWYDDVANEVHSFGAYQTLAYAFQRLFK